MILMLKYVEKSFNVLKFHHPLLHDLRFQKKKEKRKKEKPKLETHTHTHTQRQEYENETKSAKKKGRIKLRRPLQV